MADTPPVKAPKKTTRKPGEKQIKEAYKNHLLTMGKKPVTMYQFARDLKLSESELYTIFRSFEEIESAIWKDFMEETLATLKIDEQYRTFSAREKLLSFYFTHLEVLKSNRSFVKLSVTSIKNPAITPVSVRAYKSEFLQYVNGVIREAFLNNELKERPLVSQKYDQGFWVQLVFVINFWLRDSSPNFERTDAAVEKAVNLSFELLGHSALDSVLDFAKFLLQSRH